MVPLMVLLTRSPLHSPARKELSKMAFAPATRLADATETAANAPGFSPILANAELMLAARDSGSDALK